MTQQLFLHNICIYFIFRNKRLKRAHCQISLRFLFRNYLLNDYQRLSLYKNIIFIKCFGFKCFIYVYAVYSYLYNDAPLIYFLFNELYSCRIIQEICLLSSRCAAYYEVKVLNLCCVFRSL